MRQPLLNGTQDSQQDPSIFFSCRQHLSVEQEHLLLCVALDVVGDSFGVVAVLGDGFDVVVRLSLPRWRFLFLDTDWEVSCDSVAVALFRLGTCVVVVFGIESLCISDEFSVDERDTVGVISSVCVIGS